MATIFKPIKRLKSQINDLPIKSGQMILTTDTGELYFDINNIERLISSDFIYLATELDRTGLLNPIDKKIYVVEESNTMYRFTSNTWKILGSTDAASIKITTDLANKMGLDITKANVEESLLWLYKNGLITNTTKELMEKMPLIANQIIITSDTQELYFDSGDTIETSSRKSISDLIFLNTDAERISIINPLSNKIYIVIENNKTYIYSKNKWESIGGGSITDILASIVKISDTLASKMGISDQESKNAEVALTKLNSQLNSHTFWTGTQAQYDAGKLDGSITEHTTCFITDEADIILTINDVYLTSDGTTSIATKLTQMDTAITAVTTTASNAVPNSSKGAINGLATLDGTGKIPTAQIPTAVDDVIEAATLVALNALPASDKTTNKIYIALDTNITYRWGGTVFIPISNPINFANQVEAETGTENTKIMTALRTFQSIAKWITVGTIGTLDTLSNTAILATDTIKSSLEKLQGQINNKANKTDIPTTLPANGGNSDTIDNKHADGNLVTTEKINLVGAINEVFQNVSDIRTKIVTVITDTGIILTGNETIEELITILKSITKK